MTKPKWKEWASGDKNQKIIELSKKDVTYETVRQMIDEMEKQGFCLTTYGNIYKFKKKKKKNN